MYSQRNGFSEQMSNGLKPYSIIISFALYIGLKKIIKNKIEIIKVLNKNAIRKKNFFIKTPPYFNLFCFIFNLEPCRL